MWYKIIIAFHKMNVTNSQAGWWWSELTASGPGPQLCEFCSLTENPEWQWLWALEHEGYAIGHWSETYQGVHPWIVKLNQWMNIMEWPIQRLALNPTEMVSHNLKTSCWQVSCMKCYQERGRQTKGRPRGVMLLNGAWRICNEGSCCCHLAFYKSNWTEVKVPQPGWIQTVPPHPCKRLITVITNIRLQFLLPRVIRFRW